MLSTVQMTMNSLFYMAIKNSFSRILVNLYAFSKKCNSLAVVANNTLVSFFYHLVYGRGGKNFALCSHRVQRTIELRNDNNYSKLQYNQDE